VSIVDLRLGHHEALLQAAVAVDADEGKLAQRLGFPIPHG
jgi:hypothetical protein